MYEAGQNRLDETIHIPDAISDADRHSVTTTSGTAPAGVVVAHDQGSYQSHESDSDSDSDSDSASAAEEPPEDVRKVIEDVAAKLRVGSNIGYEAIDKSPKAAVLKLWEYVRRQCGNALDAPSVRAVLSSRDITLL